MASNEIDFWVEQKLSWSSERSSRAGGLVYRKSKFRDWVEAFSAGLLTGVGEKISERGELFVCEGSRFRSSVLRDFKVLEIA
jgi:hypothetical protein